VCKKEQLNNRKEFLNTIKKYLKTKGVKADKIYINQHKQEKDKLLLKIAINLNFDNLMNFHKNINIHYSKRKSDKLTKTLNQLKEIKLQRFNKLINTINKLTQRN